MSAFRRFLFLPLALIAAPLLAQSLGQSLGYQWWKAVKDENPNDLNKIANDRSRLNGAVLDYQQEGEGAIHVAVRAGNGEYLRFMLRLGANPNLIAEKAGETPLTTAVIVDRADMAQILVDFRARIDQQNRGGETPLTKAVRFHRLDMVQTFLALGADPDRADYTGKSARVYAAGATRFPQIAKALAAAPKRTAQPVAGPKFN